MKIEFISVFSLYIVIGSIVAYISRRFFKGTIRDYYVAGGRLGALVSAGTYAATTYSAFMMIGLVGLTYATGMGAYGFELVYLAATIVLLSTIGFKIWVLSRDRNWISPAQMLGELYGSRSIAVLVTAIYLFAMLPYLSAQVLGLRAVFNYGGLGDVESITLAAIIIYAWIVVAGMWSVALTDLYQGLLMLFSGLMYLSWVLVYTGDRGVSMGEVFSALGRGGYLGLTGFWSLSVFLAFTIPWAFFAITNPQVVVRLYLPRDRESYKTSVVYFFIYGFLYTLIVVLIGLIAAGLTRLEIMPLIRERDGVTPFLLEQMNPVLGSIIAVSIIAAAVSTSNSIVLAVSGSLLSCTRLPEKLLLPRLVDLALVIGAVLIAIQNPGFIVELSVLTSIILLPLAPITMFAVYVGNKGPVSKTSTVISLTVGVGFASVFAYNLGPRRTFIETIHGAPISVWTLVISTIIITLGYVVEKIKK